MPNALSTQLQALYGEVSAPQIARYHAALDRFVATYGVGPIHLFRAPGRVNLIGEHTDYNHGYVLPAALDKDVLFLVRPRPDNTVNLHNMEADFPARTFAVSPQIPSAPAGDRSNYARGVAQEMARKFGDSMPGFDALVSSAAPLGVPRGSGVSSSSALTVAVAVALAHWVDWDWQGSEMAQFCSDAEWYVGTRGGIMDQFIALLAQRNHALFLDCRPDATGEFHSQAIPLPAGYRLLVCDSGVHHANVRGEFNARVAACRAGVALLRQAYPGITHLRDVEAIDRAALEDWLPEETTVAALLAAGHDLGDLPNVPAAQPLRVRACCRHVWSENRRVLAAVDALNRDDIVALGALLNEAHASARDDYRISTPELEVLVEAARGVEGCVGARLTGAGWGGCIVALVHADAVDEFQQRVPARYQEQTGRTPTIFPCQASVGAGLVAVIER